MSRWEPGLWCFHTHHASSITTAHTKSQPDCSAGDQTGMLAELSQTAVFIFSLTTFKLDGSKEVKLRTETVE